MIPHFALHLPPMRIDWPLLLSATALGCTLAGGLAVGLQVRRTRRRVLGTLERVFEQLDLMRHEALQPAPDEARQALAASRRPRGEHLPSGAEVVAMVTQHAQAQGGSVRVSPRAAMQAARHLPPEVMDEVPVSISPRAAARAAAAPAATPARAVPPAPVVQAPAALADYQSAARLAAHGAPMDEIAERCGVVAAEARVLLALQRSAGQRMAQQRRKGAA